jgi:hypothetical protein
MRPLEWRQIEISTTKMSIRSRNEIWIIRVKRKKSNCGEGTVPIWHMIRDWLTSAKWQRGSGDLGLRLWQIATQILGYQVLHREFLQILSPISRYMWITTFSCCFWAPIGYKPRPSIKEDLAYTNTHLLRNTWNFEVMATWHVTVENIQFWAVKKHSALTRYRILLVRLVIVSMCHSTLLNHRRCLLPVYVSFSTRSFLDPLSNYHKQAMPFSTMSP